MSVRATEPAPSVTAPTPGRLGSSTRHVAGLQLVALADLAQSLGTTSRCLRRRMGEVGVRSGRIGKRSFLRLEDARLLVASFFPVATEQPPRQAGGARAARA